MHAYYLILVNSLQASIIVSPYPDIAWFAAMQFGGYNTGLALFMAALGSSIGSGFNFAIGHYLSYKRGDWFANREPLYQRIASYRHYLMFLLLFPFQSIPAIGLFWNIFVVLTGYLGVKARHAMVLIFLGRVLYYSICLAKMSH